MTRLIPPSLLTLALLTLAACGETGLPDTGIGSGMDGDCGTEALAPLVGQPWSEDLLPPREAPVRVLRPGDMMTMDHMPARLNVHLDDTGRVSALRCG